MKFNLPYIQEALLPSLGKTNKLIHFYLNEKFKEKNIDLNKEQAILLNIIHANDGLIQNELAYFTNRDKTSLTRLIHSLEKKGFVARIPSKTDKRKNEIYLTKSGHVMMDSIIPIMKQSVLELEEGISQEEKIIVKKVLTKMRNNIANNSNVAIPTNYE